MEVRKVLLTEDEMPRQWYNILADIKMNPPLGPDGKPVTPDALACIIEEAQKAKEEGKEKVILANWSGHGLIDLVAYDKYFAGELQNFALTDEELSASQKVFENFPKPELLKSR